MRQTILSMFLLLWIFACKAQMILNGADLHSTSGAILYVNTDSLLLTNNALFIQDGFVRIDKDLVNNSGLIKNDGIIDVNGSMLNNDEVEGVTSNSEFFIQADWINNGVFIPGLSTTTLDGTTQNITGTQISNFYNLTSLGALVDIKELLNIDANVLNNLDIGNVEFSTDVNTLSVTNANINAISRIDGFVSSLDAGRLNRTTNAIDEYLFPVGSSLVTERYRPIIITPESNATNIYGVRFANVEATTEGYNVDLLEDSLCLVNPNFYHRIYGDEQADISMFYKPNEDGEWTDMAYWQNNPEWEDMGNEVNSSMPGFSSLEIIDWNNFSNSAYALAVRKPFLDLGNDLYSTANQNININPLFTGSSTSNLEWITTANLDCYDCLNTVVYLEETTELILNVNEGLQCPISDTIIIYVVGDQLFLPTGFTPNNDGVNDIFKPLNDDIEEIRLSVWNRWGEKIFETTDNTSGWDGSYKGKKQNTGVYTFYVEYRLENQKEESVSQGNITLIR